MFNKADETGYRTPVDGIRQKTLTYGEKTLLCEFRLDKGAALPRHSHPHEQSGYLVAGALRLAIGDAVFIAGPGDSWTIPGGMEHGADVLEDAVAVEVFSPVREDYLP